MFKTSLAALSITAVLTGCGGLAVKTADRSMSSELTGHWVLDRQHSDDVRARLQPLFERDERRWRRDAQRLEDAPPRDNTSGNSTEEGVSNFRWMERERRKEAGDLVTWALPATQLDIRVTEREIRISNDKGEGTRTLTPGESTSLFSSVGGFTVASGWDKEWFVIDSRGSGETKIRIEERFRVVQGQLEERLEVRFPSIRKQAFKILYRRG